VSDGKTEMNGIEDIINLAALVATGLLQIMFVLT